MFNTKPVHIYVLTTLAIVSYGASVYFLYEMGWLKSESLAESVAQFFGWLIALMLAALHLTKSRADADEGRRLEVKKSFQVDAFRQVNESLTRFSTTLTNIASPYNTIPGTLYHFPVEHGEKKVLDEIYGEGLMNTASLYEGCSDFFTAFEANEIALLRFAHLKNYVGHEVEQVQKAIMEFQNFAWGKPVAQFFQGDDRKKMARYCRETSDTITALQAHISDLRILLMNEFMGDIFESEVAHRVPRDPKYSLLQEVATPEIVEKIDHQWYERSLDYQPPGE